PPGGASAPGVVLAAEAGPARARSTAVTGPAAVLAVPVAPIPARPVPSGLVTAGWPVAAVVATGPAARSFVRADPQLLTGHPRRADAAQCLRAHVGGDLHQGEPGEDRDLAQVAAAQPTLTGDRPDDVLRACPVRVPDRHPVDRSRSGELGRAAGARPATGAVASLVVRPGGPPGVGLEALGEDLFVVPGALRTLVAHALGEQRGGALEQVALCHVCGEQL